MIKIGASTKIEEISKDKNSSNKTKETKQIVQSTQNTIRPEVVDAKVYKLKSAFVKNSVFITLSYVEEETDVRPIEIFINSKDLIFFINYHIYYIHSQGPYKYHIHFQFSESYCYILYKS